MRGLGGERRSGGLALTLRFLTNASASAIAAALPLLNPSSYPSLRPSSLAFENTSCSRNFLAVSLALAASPSASLRASSS